MSRIKCVINQGENWTRKRGFSPVGNFMDFSQIFGGKDQKRFLILTWTFIQ